tara:strand:+ start:111 stop:266 length:156 start_codon:yes stop_codon:yes gene_type:complete
MIVLTPISVAIVSTVRIFLLPKLLPNKSPYLPLFEDCFLSQPFLQYGINDK